jgi:protein ImuB
LAASWLAQAGRATIVASTAQLAGNLATLRLDELAWPPAVRNALRQLGVRTLAELVRLPRDGLARRYGVHWLQMLDQAFARAPTPRRRYVAPERYRGRRELTTEIADATRLLPVVTHLLHELEDFLQTRAAAIADCRLLLEHRGGRQTRVALGLLEPGSTVARFQPLLETELAKCRLPAPVRAVRLVSGRVLPATLRTPALGLATGQRVATPPEVLLERLQARLGEAAVSGVCLIPEHRPEAAWRRQPALRGAGRRSRGAVQMHESSPDLQPPRPLWLLATPQRLELREERVWHEGPLTIESGPERIESGWWDGDDVARDYYVAVRRDAVRVWIYRERTPERRWWLHGIFG